MISHTVAIRHREISLKLPRKHASRWLAFLVLESIVEAEGKRKDISILPSAGLCRRQYWPASWDVLTEAVVARLLRGDQPLSD